MDRDTLIKDLGALLAGLQVPRSMFEGRSLGAALDPYDDIRARLGVFGWPAKEQFEQALREVLDGEQ